MERILWQVRIIHLLVILYYIAVLPLAVFGILAKYPLWNNINFILTLSILFFQAVLECPLTKLESVILKENKKGFVRRIFRRYTRLNVPPMLLTIIQALTMVVIMVSYFIYR